VKKVATKPEFDYKTEQKQTSSAFFFLSKKKKICRNLQAQTAFLPFFSPPPLSQLIKVIFLFFAREGVEKKKLKFLSFRAVERRLPFFPTFTPEIYS